MRGLMAILLLAATCVPGLAGDGSKEAQTIIADQIQAFLNDDEEKAYSFAAPGIKQMYPTPDAFFEMVKRGYAPVYRPNNFTFGGSKVEAGGDTIIQSVLIHAPDGQDWTAIYRLERQPDGSLKISAVQMIKAAASA
ncbi:DUF4864 domain-containing protein [Pararhizobium mangrovi]|uniref:DUF4864 domain-containing protein n=1 Tax=Pararhizobium mangrovi TaxID=2590452 RepID=UPI0038B405DB